MALHFNQETEEYRRVVLADLKNYEKLNRPLKAGFLERLFVRKVPLAMLHPNPRDEFSETSIGPNYSIVSDYEKYFRSMIQMQQDPIGPFDEPLIVEKMSTGGYMILNGHHRWMAARRLGMNVIPVHIVNVSTDVEIIAAVHKSTRDMCVAFDLDEILLTDGSTYPMHKELPFPLNRIYKKTLRQNASTLINELRRAGFDVWIYSEEYYTEAYLRFLFRLHGTKYDGVINAMRHRKSKSTLQNAFADKYRISLHVDNDNVICVQTRTKNYEIYDIDSVNQDWASEVVQQLQEHKEYWYE